MQQPRRIVTVPPNPARRVPRMKRSIVPALPAPPFILALALVVGVFLGSLPARSQPAGVTDVDRAVIAQVEDYFAAIDTMRARFVQQNPDGSFYSGTFYLDRPGRMRLEYDPPVPYLYVSSGYWLTFWDAELEQRSDTPIGSTLADFFVREDVSLSGDVTVAGVHRQGGLVELSIVQTDDPGAGRLVMVFSQEALRLESWVIFDPQGRTTAVTLTDRERDIPLDRSLFVAPRPGWSDR